MQSKKKSCGGWSDVFILGQLCCSIACVVAMVRRVHFAPYSRTTSFRQLKAVSGQRWSLWRLLLSGLHTILVVLAIAQAPRGLAAPQSPELLVDVERADAFIMCNAGTEIGDRYVFGVLSIPDRRDTCRLVAASPDFDSTALIGPVNVVFGPQEVAGTFLFVACDPDCKLWRTDGTLGGTKVVGNAPTLDATSTVEIVKGGLLFVGESTGTTARGVWFTDGTDAGTSWRATADNVLASVSTRYALLNGVVLRWRTDGAVITLARANSLGDWELLSTLQFPTERIVQIATSSNRAFAAFLSGNSTVLILSGDTSISSLRSGPIGYAVEPVPFHGTPTRLIYGVCISRDIKCQYFQWDGANASEPYLKPGQTLAGGFPSAILSLDDAIVVSGIGRNEGFYKLDSAGFEQLGPPQATVETVYRGKRHSVICLLDTDSNARSVWITDGTRIGTRKLRDGCDVSSVAGIAGEEAVYYQNFFATFGPYRSYKILRTSTDGTTVALRGFSSADSQLQASAVLSKDTGVFGACAVERCGLWATDGTSRGTTQLTEYPAGSTIFKMEAFGNLAFFFRFAVNGSLVFAVTDGTKKGTRDIFEFGLGPGFNIGGQKERIVQLVDGKAHFVLCPTDTVLPCGFWESDGTTAGTRLVLPLPTNIDSGRLLPISIVGQTVWVSMCRPDGCQGIAIDLQTKTYRSTGRHMVFFADAVRDGYLYFAECSSSSGFQCVLKRTNGGLEQIEEARFWFPYTDRDLRALKPFQDGFLLAAWHPSLASGQELWLLRENRVPVALHAQNNLRALDLQEIEVNNNIAYLTSFDQVLKTDGTATGTQYMPELAGLQFGYGFTRLQRVADSIVVGNVISQRMSGLWRILPNGTALPLETVNTSGPGRSESYPYFALSDRLVFVGRTVATGAEPWAITVSAVDTSDPDDDGVPTSVEIVEGLDSSLKDNDIFAATAKGVRLFVMQQYRDVFKREASEAEIAAGVAAVNAGGRAAFIASLIQSQTYDDFAGPITRLYRAYFLRNPDIGGYNFWTDEYNSLRWSFAAITGFFATSPEFRTRYGNLSNEQFVWLVYNNVLERDPDPSGLAFWLKELNDHDANPATGRSASQLMADFSESPENKQKTKAKVQRVAVYAAMLKQAAPEISITLNAPTLTETINSILGSNEYRARFLP